MPESRVVRRQPILSRAGVNKIADYDEKILSVNDEWLEQREPILSLSCGKGHQLQNYRCRLYHVLTRSVAMC